MRQQWEPEDLIAIATLVEGDSKFASINGTATRLGFVLLLGFLELEGRFPRHVGEPPDAALRIAGSCCRGPPPRQSGRCNR